MGFFSNSVSGAPGGEARLFRNSYVTRKLSFSCKYFQFPDTCQFDSRSLWDARRPGVDNVHNYLL